MIRIPSYAVLFKTHFWDDFVARQFNRLLKQVGTGDVYIIVDETKGPIDNVPYENVLRMNESQIEIEGYLSHPRGRVFWYNTDYQLYMFVDRYKQYDYLFQVEYDCHVGVGINQIISAMEERGLSFVGEPIRSGLQDWYWKAFSEPFYSEDVDLSGRLVCCAAFSKVFVMELRAARLEHARRVSNGKIEDLHSGGFPWPNNEAVVGAEISRLGVAEARLAEFADVSHYDWAPPFLETELCDFPTSAIVHPVLDGPRFIRSIVRLKWDITDLFRDGSELSNRMERRDPGEFVPLFLRYFAEEGDWEAVERLRGYARRRFGKGTEKFFNVARGKPANQSSTSFWSRSPGLKDDAAGAVNGRVTGSYGFHTGADDLPWWCVDLEAEYPIREIRIYNRMSLPERARSLIVKSSRDMEFWETLYTNDEDKIFGGADGRPLRIALEQPLQTRFIRISLAERNVLHLDEVEIYI